MENPINGAPEGSVGIWGSEVGLDKANHELIDKKRETNFWDAGRLTAKYAKVGEDAVVWDVTYK